jgi:hypothetical protein
LQKVAEFGTDGKLDYNEAETLRRMVFDFNRSGDSEPAAVTGANGKPLISKDDIMENSTFQAALTNITQPGFGGSLNQNFGIATGKPNAELQALITSADYDKLSYGERVLLMQAADRARSDGTFSDSESADIIRMMKGFLATDEQPTNKMAVHTLGNGAEISIADVADPGNFAAAVQQALKGSSASVTTGNNTNSLAPYNFNNIAIPQLMGLDVSELSVAQRLEVLEMIVSAAKDGQIDRDELISIHKEVNPNYMGMGFPLGFA